MEEFAYTLQGKHDALLQTHVETTEALQAEIESMPPPPPSDPRLPPATSPPSTLPPSSVGWEGDCL